MKIRMAMWLVAISCSKDYTKSKELLLEGFAKFPTSEMLEGNLKVLEEVVLF
ncbi:MAG: hypothetical protein R2779_04715 [Crocinitomicaceae bacterium]